MHCTAVLIYSPNLQGFYRVLSCRTQISVAPSGFHTHLPFIMGITESRQMPRRLPFTSEWTHPQAGAANTAPVVSGTTSPLWTQGSCPQPTHRHTPFKLACSEKHTNVRDFAWMHSCSKNTYNTNTHPQCYHLVKIQYHWRQEGQPFPWKLRFYQLQGMEPITFGLSLFVIWDQVSSLEVWNHLFLSKQKSTHRSNEGQCGWAPSWHHQSDQLDDREYRVTEKPVVATPTELAWLERAISLYIMAIFRSTLMMAAIGCW